MGTGTHRYLRDEDRDLRQEPRPHDPGDAAGEHHRERLQEKGDKTARRVAPTAPRVPISERQVEVGSRVAGVSQSASGGSILMTLGDA